MSLVKCGTISCTHHVREGSRKSGHASDGSDLADGVFCWRCRRRQRPKSRHLMPAGRRGIEPRAPDLESRAATKTRPAPSVDEALVRRLRRSPALRAMLESSEVLTCWVGGLLIESAVQRQRAHTLRELGLVVVARCPDGYRFAITDLGSAIVEVLRS